MGVPLYPAANLSHANPRLVVNGTRKTEPSFTPEKPRAWDRGPRTYKTYRIEQLRRIKEIRSEAAEEERLLPPLPCPFKDCMSCEGYREFWDEALKPQLSLAFN